jgi:Fe-S-cluster containining protein
MDRMVLSGCARCATLGKTCCQTREILVTTGDRERIAAYAGVRDFWEYTRPTDPAYLEQDHDPNWLRWAFRPDGARPILKRRPNGDCRFLGEAGCVLPMEVRPLVCRLYPYVYTEHGIEGVADECPRAVVPPGQTIVQVLDMRIADAVRWHELLYAEIRSQEPQDVDRTDVRLAG